VGVAIYLASIVLHEVAHALCANRVGGRVDCLVLGPVGGLRPALLPSDPRSRVFVAMAGPLTHLALVVLGCICLALKNDTALPSLLTLELGAGSASLFTSVNEPAILLARLAVWINWPAYPFDGEPALRSWLSQWLGNPTAEEFTRRLALTIGALLILVSPLAASQTAGLLTPAVLLVSLGVVLVFSSLRQASGARTGWGELFVGPHYDQAGNSLLDMSQWLDSEDDRMVLVEMRQGYLDLEDPSGEPGLDDHRIDAVLAKVHDQGIDELTAEERSLLDRASQLYRRRRES
jgi:Zn-dependent protease